jgi:hypothetical protein
VVGKTPALTDRLALANAIGVAIGAVLASVATLIATAQLEVHLSQIGTQVTHIERLLEQHR